MHSLRRAVRTHRTPLLLILSYSAITVALLASSPPGAGPDEYAHYLKAAAAGRGHLVLDRDPPPLGREVKGMAWMDTQDRLVSLPERLAPDPFLCWAQPFFVGECADENPDSSALRDFSTYIGRYPPYAYIVPGLLMRLSPRPIESLYLGRLGSALESLLLLGTAVILLHDRSSRFSLMGLLGGVTPMVLYVFATLSSSGVEMAAGICFFAGLLRIARAPEPAPRWVWFATAAGGAALAVTRDLGPLWVALSMAMFIAITGIRRVRELAGTRRGRAAAAAVGLSVAVALVWQFTQGAKSPLTGFTGDALGRAVNTLPDIAHQAIGIFGALDTPLPQPAVILWTGILLTLLVAALVSGTPTERAVLLLAVAALIVLATAFQVVQDATGFRAQARHLLPFAVTIPMLAGEIVARNHSRTGWKARGLVPALGVCAAAAFVIAWHTIGRRYSVGANGPMMFVAYAKWIPVVGWWFWAFVMASGVGILLGSTAQSWNQSTPSLPTSQAGKE